MERQEYHLFPLILGLTLASAGAFGWYLVVGARRPADPVVASSAAVAPKLPERVAEPPISTAPPAPAAMVAAPTEPATPVAPLAPASEADPKIWQCDVNGQRVFTDFKCASDAKPTALAAVNRMNAVPVQPYYSHHTVPPSASAGPEPYDGGEEPMTSTPVYAPYPVVYALRPRAHPHRPPPHSFPHHGER